MLGGPVEDQGTARENEQNDRLAGSDYGFQNLLLIARQIEVCARARLAAHAVRFPQREDDYIGRPGRLEGLRETRLRGIVDLCSSGVKQGASQLPGALCQRLPEGDDVTILTGATPDSDHLSSVVGERSDESDPFDCRRKREQRCAGCEFAVLKQDEGLFGCFADQRPVLGDGSGDLDAFRVGTFKESGGELDAEDAPHSLIDHSHGNLARADQPRQLGVVKVRHHVDIDAGGDGLSGSRRRVERDAVIDQLHDGGVVADDEPVEAPLPAQNLTQKKWIGAGRHAIEGVEGAHDGGGARPDSGLVGRQVDLAET